MDNHYFLYLLTNTDGSRIYTGITNDLKRRVSEHLSGRGGRYTRAFPMTRLVYYETCDDLRSAMARERAIKASGRAKKVALIDAMNPGRKDLFAELD